MPPEDPSSSKRFEDRLRDAQARQRSGAGKEAGPAPDSALGVGLRIGVELVSAVVVGVGIGWLLDWWLGTQPWLLMVFFLLGAGAGMLNVYRAVGRMSSGGIGGGTSGTLPRDVERD